MGRAGKAPRHREGRERAHEDGESAHLSPGLYVTATPIGNASDVTLRALDVLTHCDAIVAEDTRVTSRLLAIHGISRPLLAYNDHNAPAMRPKLMQRLREGARLALVSDAGTPLVSDPGLKLVQAALADHIAVHPVPGPSAALAALVGSGLASDRFCFAGFLPPRSGERRTVLEGLKAIPGSLIFFESPNRIAETLADMAAILGDRPAAIGRELTKLHEEFRRGTLGALAEALAQEAPPKGELTLVVGPPVDSGPDEARIDSLLRQALPRMGVSGAAALVADALAVPRRLVYARALKLKDLAPDGTPD
jgi:16S rRNA (cytidine1402-2'-O)-methyltransferase